ncbi:nuclear transport factor 2 family protein [Streptomyces sp. RG80]|uniref:nuclear transport factor 2 family protein n=1 Tax=Streptomyces sp. RG80 TaxID=3157340 RepID=UPI00338D502D
MDPIERLLAERACERLIVDFVRRLDLGEPGSVAELFTADGSWEWPVDGRRFAGRAALREYFGSRPEDRLSRRVMTNILVTVATSDTATATSYFTTYRVDGHDGGPTPIPSGPPVQVGHYEDAFRRSADGTWLLASRVLHLPFGGPTPQASGASA